MAVLEAFLIPSPCSICWKRSNIHDFCYRNDYRRCSLVQIDHLLTRHLLHNIWKVDSGILRRMASGHLSYRKKVYGCQWPRNEAAISLPVLQHAVKLGEGIVILYEQITCGDFYIFIMNLIRLDGLGSPSMQLISLYSLLNINGNPVIFLF